MPSLKLSRADSEDSKEVMDATNTPLGEVTLKALRPPASSIFSAIGPPPKEPLPALPAPTVTAKPALDGLPSALHDTFYHGLEDRNDNTFDAIEASLSFHDLSPTRRPPAGPLPPTPQVHLPRAVLVEPATSFADNSLDLIEADLDPFVPVPEETPATKSSLLLDSDSFVLDSSLLVTWSDLDAPEVPVNDPATATESPNLPTCATEDSSFVDPNLLATSSDFGYSSPTSRISLPASAESPPGPGMSTPTKTPSREELGPTFLRSAPESASCVYTPVYSRESLRLSLPRSLHLTTPLTVGSPTCVTRARHVSRVGGAPLSRNWSG
ncbi:hypothetical protein GYMLUDRAFT_691911 [Collybiopsis luxurians FD-317 M1]|uniref:Uncharacterized protein n=1 Tax=Collybiopsis luxurians FD-317 M1 TaxID=944289 RepID=A0A0D0B5D8_9AGAR|nr:hypothetical protein GYMLUDRAFT_691911 [Collybiopsis luxurians FD-317 M1]